MKSTRTLIFDPLRRFDRFYDLYQRQTIACDIEDLSSEMITLHPYEPAIEFRLTQEDEDYYLSRNLEEAVTNDSRAEIHVSSL